MIAICSFCPGKHPLVPEHVASRNHRSALRKLKKIDNWWKLDDLEFKNAIKRKEYKKDIEHG